MDIKTQLHEAITELQNATRRGELPREPRLMEINTLAESYYAKTGELPDAVALERLADLCLYEELTDDDEHKVSRNEYPILSERQFDRRDNREIKSANDMDGNAADGQKHGVPTRRARSDYENTFVNKKAKIANKERKKIYHEFTKVQPIITSFLSR